MNKFALISPYYSVATNSATTKSQRNFSSSAVDGSIHAISWYRPVTYRRIGTQSWVNKRLIRVESEYGYILGDTLSAYYRDFQGNICAVVRNNQPIQATSYYPYGLPMAESSKADVNRLKYSGKELVTHRGYDAYDFGPRNRLPTLCLFDNPDLLQEKFYDLHPSNYCAANPIRNVDPSGMVVIATQREMQDLIKGTLHPDAEQYVQFDENGVLNSELLRQCDMESKNLECLLTLATSEQNYFMTTASEFTDGLGETREFIGNRETGITGVTMTPNAPEEANPSPDNDIHIVVSDLIPMQEQVKTLSHEAYGHGYIFDCYSRGNRWIYPYHEYKGLPDYSDFSVIRVDINKALINWIQKSVEETNNYNLLRYGKK